jgi:hypothetical protein
MPSCWCRELLSDCFVEIIGRCLIGDREYMIEVAWPSAQDISLFKQPLTHICCTTCEDHGYARERGSRSETHRETVIALITKPQRQSKHAPDNSSPLLSNIHKILLCSSNRNPHLISVCRSTGASGTTQKNLQRGPREACISYTTSF